MLEELLRHPCSTHPDNAAQFVRGHHTLQGETSWRLLGLDRLVSYCPWCGANLSELHRLLSEANTRVERAAKSLGIELPHDATELQAARLRLLYEAPRITETHPLAPPLDDPELGTWREFSIKPKTSVDATVYTAAHRCGVRLLTRAVNRGVILQSIRVVRTDGTSEEQLMHAGVPIELYLESQPHDGFMDVLPLGPGETLVVTLHNPTDRTLAAEVAAVA